MFKTFKKNSKWIMAIVGVVLMIVFFLPNNMKNQNGIDPETVVVAHVYDDQPVSLLEKNALIQQVQVLRQLKFKDNDSPLLLSIRGLNQYVAEQMVNDPDEFLALVLEARHLGLQPSSDEVQQIMDLTDMPSDDDDPNHVAQASIEDLVLLTSLLTQVGDIVKVSQPFIDQNLAQEGQEVSLSIVDFSAANYLSATTQPTEAQIQGQYDTYKDNLPKTTTDQNPLGFGYKYPNRVKLEYIGFLNGDLLDAAIASQSDVDWNIQARRYYRTHPDIYASTQPTTQASTPTTAPAAVTPWDQLSAQTQHEVMEDVQRQASTDLAGKISSRIAQQLSADWAMYQQAIAANQKPPLTDFKCPFDSSAYIPALAASIENEFHVLPRNGLLASSWLSADSLRLQEGIGNSVDPAGTPPDRSFGDYATQAGFSDKGNPPELAIYQPSDPLTADVGGTYYFRLTAVDPSHPAPLDECRDQVAGDIRTQEAWNKLSQYTDSLLRDARASTKFGILAIERPSAASVYTGMFDLSTMMEPSTELIPVYGATGESAILIKEGAVKALVDKEAGKPAIEKVLLPDERKIAIIQLVNVLPLWTDSNDKARMTNDVIHLGQYVAERIGDEWSIHDNLLSRINYKVVPK